MKINIPVCPDLMLKIDDKPENRAIYATSRLLKGLALNYRGIDLVDEAVGFGLPVIKRGLQAIFPGNLALSCVQGDSTWVITALYGVNFVEKIVNPDSGIIKNRLLYALKNYFAAMIRQFPSGRGFLTNLSNKLRGKFGWETTYEAGEFSTLVKLIYTFNEESKILIIEADLTSIPEGLITEVIVMNEQGAKTFDQYLDSSGSNLLGDEIGCWDEVTASEATFASSTLPVAFTLYRIPGAKLFRGRELIGTRLAWSGFGYSFPPSLKKFSYKVKIGKPG